MLVGAPLDVDGVLAAVGEAPDFERSNPVVVDGEVVVVVPGDLESEVVRLSLDGEERWRTPVTGRVDDVVLREFLCPGCGTALALNVQLRDEEICDEARFTGIGADHGQ